MCVLFFTCEIGVIISAASSGGKDISRIYQTNKTIGIETLRSELETLRMRLELLQEAVKNNGALCLK